MQKVRSPTYAENYANLARAVVLKVVVDTLQGKEDLKDYILTKLDSMGINKRFIYPDNNDISNRIFNKNKENYGL